MQQFGAVAGVTGAFGPGETLFVAADGSLTRAAPLLGWRQSVGYATAANAVVIVLGISYRPREDAGLLIRPGDTVITAIFVAAFTPEVTKAILSNLRDSLPELPTDGDPAPGWYRNGGTLYEYKA